jgi:hypothetical protein
LKQVGHYQGPMQQGVVVHLALRLAAPIVVGPGLRVGVLACQMLHADLTQCLLNHPLLSDIIRNLSHLSSWCSSWHTHGPRRHGQTFCGGSPSCLPVDGWLTVDCWLTAFTRAFCCLCWLLPWLPVLLVSLAAIPRRCLSGRLWLPPGWLSW